MEEKTFTPKELQNTTPLKGQEYCAYVYLMGKEPRNGVHGLIKIICTGSSEKDVKANVAQLMNDNKLEKNLPHINIGPTGTYGHITSGSNPDADKEIYNTVTKQMVTEIDNDITEKRKAAAREVREATKKVQQESNEAMEEDPFSYETYCAHRSMYVTAASRVKQMEGELEHIKMIKNKALKARREVEKKHPAYRLKYKQQYVNAETEEEEEEEKGGRDDLLASRG